MPLAASGALLVLACAADPPMSFDASAPVQNPPPSNNGGANGTGASGAGGRTPDAAAPMTMTMTMTMTGAGGSPPPATGGTGGTTSTPTPTASCSGTPGWQTCINWAKFDYGPYYVRNNIWNSMASGAGQQCMWASSFRCFGANAQHSDPGRAGAVKGYAQIVRGWVIGTPTNSGFLNNQHGLNIRVSDLRKAKVRWSMEAGNRGRVWSLWDVYFHDGPPSTAKAAANLMIQQYIVDETGWMQRDSAPWPRVTFDGITYREKRETNTVSSNRNRIQLYIDRHDGAVLGSTDATIDLKKIIDHYVMKGDLKSTDTLTSIQAGWEIVEGGTYKTLDFWTAVQDEVEPK